MIMRKTVAIVALALALGAGTASASSATEGRNIGKLSIGYQGLDLNTGSGEFSISGVANGLSSRYWINNEVGIEGNLYLQSASRKYPGSYDDERSVLAGTIKGMYAPVVKENSRFYVGLEAGLGRVHYEQNYVDPEDFHLNESYTNTLWLVRPLVGAEYNFAGIPELGVNFEVGYLFSGYDDSSDGSPSDTYDMSGISIGAGVHYFF